MGGLCRCSVCSCVVAWQVLGCCYWCRIFEWFGSQGLVLLVGWLLLGFEWGVLRGVQLRGSSCASGMYSSSLCVLVLLGSWFPPVSVWLPYIVVALFVVCWAGGPRWSVVSGALPCDGPLAVSEVSGGVGVCIGVRSRSLMCWSWWASGSGSLSGVSSLVLSLPLSVSFSLGWYGVASRWRYV